ncbi:hypothetical protein MTR67_004442 [Solanum verrucosum]|uniref:Reverse transcriptase domain-containing protein n=1 Tax=Solanum verrucosum TaxID=315347 RepID=A0AAF0PUK9_SOLVR|nr:hypothetical protein MTR67_004442 [Solanum verrucosum]
MASKKSRLVLNKVKNENGDWIEGNYDIAKEAISFFEKQFTKEDTIQDESILNYLPKVIETTDNEELCKEPTMQEVKDVVFGMNSESSPGPDGVNGTFYKKCWDVIAKDLHEMILEFFSGSDIPRFISHSCLILIPKVRQPQKLNEFRPISLSNFSCKIISKILSNRLIPYMSKIISPNQTGFIKGRSISENIILTQEMAHNMKGKQPNSNVIMKLDMEKAYDRVSWNYLIQVLKQLGFSEAWNNMIWRLISNNWYSININGTRHGFFKSSRGLKQGDPLSPSLFVIGAELLTRLLDSLVNHNFTPFQVDKNSPIMTHLCYADDTILFSSGDPLSLAMMMHKLDIYEKISGQKINKSKSGFIVHPKASDIFKNEVKAITGFSNIKLPFTYLGSPIFVGRKKICYFNDMVVKISNKVMGWHTKTLSIGGKTVMIKAVLSSLPMHILSVIQPPKTIIKQMEMVMANFFWGDTHGKNKHHWIKWRDLCYPTHEGGVGIKSIQSFCDAFSAKNWWNFRTENSLIKQFLEAKYCKRMHPVARKDKPDQSHTWRRLMSIKDRCEPYMIWRIGDGYISFWWENWTGKGALAKLLHLATKSKKVMVADFIINGNWNELKLGQELPSSIVNDILQIQIYKGHDNYLDC